MFPSRFSRPGARLLVITAFLPLLTSCGDSGDDPSAESPSSSTSAAAGSEHTSTSGSERPALTLSTQLPPDWSAIAPEAVYAEGMLSIRGPAPALTFATTTRLDGSPSRSCGVPTNLLDAMGPIDAMISAFPLDAAAYVNPRPDVDAFLPDSGPDNAYWRCMKDKDALRMKVVGFHENGTMVQVWVATGLSVSEARVEDIRTIIRHLRVGR